jgi:hypothetical protein
MNSSVKRGSKMSPVSLSSVIFIRLENSPSEDAGTGGLLHPDNADRITIEKRRDPV